MRGSTLKWISLGSILLLASTSPAQNLEDYLSRYLGENGQKYLQPLGDAFGANLNSGLYHTAHIPRVGLRLGFDVIVAGALIADDQKTFMATTEEGFNPPATREAPTVFGDGKIVAVPGNGGTVYNFPGGYEVDMLPLVIPQVTVGTLFGTEATLRYAAFELNKDVGDLSLFGIGLRHSLSQYIPLFPIDVAASYFHQTLQVGDIVEARTNMFGLQASKSFSVLTLYGGLAYESATLEATYKHGEGEEAETISFDMDGQNQMRMTLGATLKLAILQLHADYSLASQKSFCLGLYVGL